MIASLRPVQATIALVVLLLAGTAPAQERPRRDAELTQAERLYDDGARLYDEGKLDEAIAASRQALAIRERLLDPDDSLIAASLVGLAASLHQKGEYAAAEPLYRRGLAIIERLVGPEHDAIASVVGRLATLLKDRGDLAGAEPLYRRALAISEKLHGPASASVAHDLQGLATLLHEKGDYAAAESLCRRSLAIQEKTFGSESEPVAETAGSLAVLLHDRGDLAGSEALYRRVLILEEKLHGPAHPDVATVLANLGALLEDQGVLVEAESLYRRALAIREKTLGPDHPDVAVVVGNLAVLRQERGDYAGAESLQRRALAIREKVYGPQSSAVGSSILLLAETQKQLGDATAAEASFRRALAIKEAALGPEHPEVSAVLRDLAVLLFDRGDVAGAEPLFRRSLAIDEKSLGADHPSTAGAMQNLAEVLAEKGDAAGAESLLRHALAIMERSRGPEHREVAVLLSNLSGLLVGQHRVDEALALRARSADIVDRLMATLLAGGNEKDKAAYFATLRADTHSLVSLHADKLAGNDAALRLALTTILRRKGRLLEASVDSMAALRRAAVAADLGKLDRLATLRSELARRALRGGENGRVAEEAALVAKLGAEADALDAELGDRYAGVGRTAAPVTIASVQSRLPPDAALVEIVRYQRFDDSQRPGAHWRDWRYAAYVLPSTGSPRFAPLGEAEPIDRLVSDLRASIARADPGFRQAARDLDERVLRPVRALLGDCRDVYLSPDGALNLVPFAALVDEHDRFLITSYRFTLLTSGRDLLDVLHDARPPSRAGPPVIVAGPDYDRAPLRRAASRSPSRRSVDMGTLTFTSLPGALREGRELAQKLPRARLLVGAAATEGAVKELHSPRLLHIATHGFFLGNRERSSGGRGVELVEEAPAVEAVEDDPLLRSGLALAGANVRVSASAEDGILTALEVTGLDLWGTKLVVLSACETGLGAVTNGDGVYGLRRALVLAGSEAQIMSLWKVDDEATRLLMIDIYRRLAAGAGRSAALRDAQLALLARPTLAHPYYWAAFLASGDQRSLDGHPPAAVRRSDIP